MLRIKGEEVHHEPKGESHSFCMNLVPLFHAWSDGIISLGDRAASRHLEVPSSPHFKRIRSIWCWPQMCWIRPCRPSVCQQERDSWRWWLSGSQTHFLVRKTQGMTLNFGLSKYTQMTVFQLLIIHISAPNHCYLFPNQGDYILIKTQCWLTIKNQTPQESDWKPLKGTLLKLPSKSWRRHLQYTARTSAYSDYTSPETFGKHQISQCPSNLLKNQNDLGRL